MIPLVIVGLYLVVVVYVGVFAVALLIVRSAWALLLKSGRILLERSPDAADPDEAR